MRYRILGPPELLLDGRPVGVGGPQQRALLALLLLEANRVVSADRLVDQLWGERPPSTARGLLQGCVAQLRRALRAGDRQPLVTRPPGYMLEVRPGELDLARFEDLVARAATATPDEASDLLHEALALWRGPFLDGVVVEACQAEAARMHERRLVALEQRVDADLLLGRHASLVGELRTQVREHPLRERLWAQYMLALHGADRRADALAAYREVRTALVDQLGVEPGGTLQQVERAILTDADPLAAYRGPTQPTPAGPPRGAPAQLPPAVPAFTGRKDQLKQLAELLPGHDGTAAAPVVICAIAGTAGVGKTALAVHWAHQVRDRFTDGQLYVNLRGHAQAPPIRPIEALAGFLHALRVPAEQVPVELDQAAALYRTLLADKRMLVVLDNVGSAEQARPLLPASPGCLVLITSRDRLGGLVARDGARRVTLDVLSPEEATALLARIIGAERAGAEPEAVAELARLCAYLPLALRIAAASLTDHPHRSIAGHCAFLAADDRLDTLEVDGDEETAVRAAFELSYRALPAEVRRVFRLLGLVPGPEVTAEAAAALAGTSPQRAARLLDRLAGAHLLDRRDGVGSGSPGGSGSVAGSGASPAGSGERYAFHDLLRLYAGERVREEDSEEERAAAAGRLADWYLSTVDAAARLLNPEMLRLPVDLPPVAGFDGYADAVAWLDAERPNLVAAIRDGFQPAPWLLADRLRGYLWLRMYTVDWLVMARASLAAAVRAGDPAGQAAIRLSLGNVHTCQSRYAQSVEEYNAGLALAREAGWVDGQTTILGNLGSAYRWMGRLPEAVASQSQGLAIARETGRVGGQATTLGNLGLVYWEMGELTLAAESHFEGLVLHRQLGSRYGEAVGLVNLGEAYHALGRLDEARDLLETALAMHRAARDRTAEGETVRILAGVHRDQGRLGEAYRLAEAAVELAREPGDRRIEADTLNTLGSICVRQGDRARAADLHDRALSLALEAQARYPELVALTGLATALGTVERARVLGAQAVRLAAQAGYRLLEGQARLALAHAQDDPCRAVAEAREAVAVNRATGHRLGEARALLLLGRRTGGQEHLRAALALLDGTGAPEADEVRALLR
jgi:DNA-binding SARP family transcriptional activator